MTTKKSEAVKPTEADALGAILTKLGDMEERITEMETRSSEPPKLFIDQPDVKAPTVHNQIPEGTPVKLKESSERYAAIMSKLDTLTQDAQDIINADGVRGRVTDRWYENKLTGDHKYKIDFDGGVGSVGIKLSDLEVVS
jgi:hypothetical protein